jgi:hypothetical protein
LSHQIIFGQISWLVLYLTFSSLYSFAACWVRCLQWVLEWENMLFNLALSLNLVKFLVP